MKNMKRISLTFICLVFIIISSSCVHEHDCEIEPEPTNNIEDGFTSTLDTDFISQLDPATKKEIRVRNNLNGSDFHEDGYIRFNDFTEVEQYVQFATLKLYIKANPKANIFFPNDYTLHISALQEGWNENTLSHASKPAAEQKITTIFPADNLKPGDLYEIDVTEILNDQFTNKKTHHGFGISLVANNKNESVAISFHSSDNGNATLNPDLEVVYEW